MVPVNATDWPRVQTHAAFVLVDEANLPCRLVRPVNAQVAGLEALAQLVAHQIDDGLEGELGRHALLDAVDQRQLAGALLELHRALGHLLLQPGGEAQVGQRDRGLGGEHRQQVAVGVVEAAARAFDVGVHVAQQFLPRDQRGDQARALVRRFLSRGPVAQARLAGVAGLNQPGRDGLEQCLRVLTAREQRPGRAQALRCLQQQQNALGAQELGRLVDQERMKIVLAARFVQPKAGANRPLEALAQGSRFRGRGWQRAGGGPREPPARGRSRLSGRTCHVLCSRSTN